MRVLSAAPPAALNQSVLSGVGPGGGVFGFTTRAGSAEGNVTLAHIARGVEVPGDDARLALTRHAAAGADEPDA
jgi:hypothetical protein